jgi:acetyl esterase/lipase
MSMLMTGLGTAALAASTLLSCDGGGGGVTTGSERYVDLVFASVSTTHDVTYATAPDLRTGAAMALDLDVYEPVGDALEVRPVIVWIHGGGFKGGDKDTRTIVSTASAYARRGYVTIGIDYRLDPGNRCQEIQDGTVTDPKEIARCGRAIRAAQHDAQAAVRWARANAGAYGLDPDRVAVAGFSAGAITAVNVAQRSDDPGTVGDHLDEPSTVDVALAASGCNPDAARSIDAQDAPISILASELDQAVDFACVVDTADRSEAAGVATERLFHLGEGGHAAALYRTYKAETDQAWTAFLVEHLRLA